MATGDTLGIGVSGLLAFQRAIATSGHNISNAATAGYSRQRVNLAAAAPQATPSGFLGTGVRAQGVERIYDRFLNDQIRFATSTAASTAHFHGLAAGVDRLLTDASSGLTGAIGQFFAAVQDLANQPASLPARQAVFAGANALVDRFRVIDAQLAGYYAAVNSDLRAELTTVNDLADSIARLNEDVALGLHIGQSPNDSMDRRDELIQRLAGKLSVSIAEQSDGTVNVFVGNGQSLVVGGRAQKLALADSAFDPTRKEVGYDSGGGVANGSTQLGGGTIGALLDFRVQILDAAQNTLGQIAVGLAASFNDQHRRGMDLNGALGADFFAVPGAVVTARAANTGAGVVAAVIDDGTALTASDYLVEHAGGGAWTVRRLSDGATWSGAGPFQIDGLVITPGGAPATGDGFLVRPASEAAARITTLLADPREIAAGAPILAAAAPANSGTARISDGVVLDASDPALLAGVTLTFVDAANYQIDGAGPLNPYTAGANIDVNGWRVQITGSPAAGDSFSVSAANAAVGDNRNALLLGALQDRDILAGATASHEEVYSRLVGEIGALVQAADIGRSAQQAILDQAVSAREAVSGVNLDEEAADLMRFQQAYQAAAEVVQVAGRLFDVLMSAMRR
jgi:flagellar hook-associated protein 1 FlgK